jgi:hypothetical protein
MEEERITIIEGPTPTFESIQDGWALGLNEGPYLYDLALTRLRTFNGPSLVERCYRAWQNGSSIFLYYRNRLGLEEHAPIMAARAIETDDGQVLLLWIRRTSDQVADDIDVDLDEDDPDGQF